MRMYFFTNMYLSSIQQGIQPLHVLGDMMVKYNLDDSADPIQSEAADMLYDWAAHHKTVICLNGGFSQNIRDLYDSVFTEESNPYPYCLFHEGKEALDNALTSIGIIVPESVYIIAKYVKRRGIDRGALNDLSKGKMNDSAYISLKSIQEEIDNDPYISKGFNIIRSLELLSTFDIRLIDVLNDHQLAS